jgi:hypothetical protein
MNEKVPGVGFIEVEVWQQGRTGVRTAKLQKLKLKIEPSLMDGESTIELDSDGRPGDALQAAEGHYEFSLRRGSYPFSRDMRQRTGDSSVIAPRVGVEVRSGETTRIELTAIESPTRRLRRNAIWAVVLIAFSLLLFLDGDEIEADGTRDRAGVVAVVYMMFLMFGVAAAAISEVRSFLAAAERNEIGRRPATIAADGLKVFNFLLLVAVSTVVGLLSLAETGWVEIVRTRAGSATAHATIRDVYSSVAWHAADSIPVVDAPAAWGWGNPIRVTGDGAWFAGVPFLLTRVLIAIGVVGLVVTGWRSRDRSQTSQVRQEGLEPPTV